MNILLDDDRDWTVANGQLQLVTGQDEIAQKIEVELRTILGEWFLDVTRGVPWFSRILKKAPNPTEIQNLLINKISSVRGVLAIQEFVMNFDNSSRQLTITARIQTTDGILDFSTEAP